MAVSIHQLLELASECDLEALAPDRAARTMVYDYTMFDLPFEELGATLQALLAQMNFLSNQVRQLTFHPLAC
jgi:hypothetical protein